MLYWIIQTISKAEKYHILLTTLLQVIRPFTLFNYPFKNHFPWYLVKNVSILILLPPFPLLHLQIIVVTQTIIVLTFSHPWICSTLQDNLRGQFNWYLINLLLWFLSSLYRKIYFLLLYLNFSFACLIFIYYYYFLGFFVGCLKKSNSFCIFENKYW